MESESRPDAGKVNVGFDVRPFVNLAYMQNGLPLAGNLRIANESGEMLENLVCSFHSPEGVIVPSEERLPDIPAGADVFKAVLDIRINQRMVSEVRDPVAAKITLKVESNGEEVYRHDYPVTVLSYNQHLWSDRYPELLSAFVFPNAELVNQLQAEASHEVGRATGSTALEGYQGGKKRVLEICAAIYRAIQNRGISYCNPPSSYGTPGQKFRLPDEIEKYKLGTCIETALLFASVMEKCCLHPVLILCKEHCYIGCHLIGQMMDQVVTYDLEALRKRADLDEFIAIETTKATSDAPFNEAEQIGRARLRDEETFRYAIDVVRSRESGILPLVLESGIGSGSAYTAKGRDVAAQTEVDVRDVQDSLDLSTLKKAETTQGRIEKWTQKLLDFSARNKLLNIPRSSKQVIRLLGSNVGALEDQLAANETITIRSIAESVGEKALEDFIQGKFLPDQEERLFNAELAHHRLCVALPPKDVRKRLSDLYHDAKTALEESGVNTLFLAIGLLQWRESESGAKAYKAPILLAPVRLERTSLAEGVKMYRLDEDTTINTTLIEFLRTQFGIVFPGLDPLPMDESGVDVRKILQIIKQSIKDKKGWEVLDEALVGCFSFGKFVMWKDMTERVDELKKNPLVNHLIGGGGEFEDGIEVFKPEDVANHMKPGDIYCPVSADSSQLTAVLYSEMGKTFVLHGPPGTGKSQTITNIIAHNLAKGRRVLFVSEKKAALDVVRNRLDRIGLTPFCLELHSNKTEKAKFYEQLKEALSVAETSVPGEWDQVVSDLTRCKDELNTYISALHYQYSNGLTAYHCFSQTIQYGSDSHPELIGIDCLRQSRTDYRESRQAVADLLNDFRGVSEESLQTTPPLKSDTWSPVLERQLKQAAEALSAEGRTLVAPFQAVRDGFGLKEEDSAAYLASVAGLLETIKSERTVPRRYLDGEKGKTPEYLEQIRTLAETCDGLAKRLSGYRLDQFGGLDFDGIRQRMAANGKAFVLFRPFKNKALLKELSGIVKTGGERLTIKKLEADLCDIEKYRETERKFREKSGFPVGERKEIPLELQQSIESFLECWSGFVQKRDKFLEFVQDDILRYGMQELFSSCEALASDGGDLRGVMRYRKTLARVQSFGMGAFAEYMYAHDDGAMDILRIFDDSYAAKMLDAILAQTPVLAEFTGLNQQERIERFRLLDRKYAELTKKVVFAKLAATLPRRRKGPCPEGTELGKIKRECEKKTRHKAVRQMLAESKTLIPTLKPCFLMSPLSVAQYLPVDTAPFDLIVFDEASQIPVWDAIGVIARGKQLVVVGDPKQMPPTNFFQKGDSESELEDNDSIADQESILDECLVAGVHSTYLNWHYRSRHESLIAFSNEHYYSNKLYTFPAAADTPRLGVKFMFVEGGVCEKGGKGPKVNRIEAAALVDYICREVKKPGYKPRSIGVVTFSLPQQKEIRTLLEERRSEDSELEKLLPEEGPNAYFVKNLENVQGDESDVILFSVGFAPDENGKFAMNFGPLNRSGGERRLNVAVTRAKEQVVVFSSIHASQIDAGEDGRTKSVGAGHLRAFLEYAEKGRVAKAASACSADGERFSSVVSKFLEESGYQVVRHVGCSRYRIDIAVRDPEDSSRYLLGVECDGPAYAGQRTAQDRDVNRAGVLRGLGWHLCRVWSLDWAYDRKRAEETLLKTIEEIRKGERAPAPEPSPEIEETAVATEDAPVVESTAAAVHPAYKPWSSPVVYPHDRFYDGSVRNQIRRMMTEIVAAEGPIYEAVLRKRVAKAWGLTRMTDNVNKVLDVCMPVGLPVTRHETGTVYWPVGSNPMEYAEYRISSDDEQTKRTLEEIPPEEIANAMCEVLSELGGCHKDELYREAIKCFGLSSLTAKARKFMDVAFASLRQSGRI